MRVGALINWTSTADDVIDHTVPCSYFRVRLVSPAHISSNVTTCWPIEEELGVGAANERAGFWEASCSWNNPSTAEASLKSWRIFDRSVQKAVWDFSGFEKSKETSQQLCFICSKKGGESPAPSVHFCCIINTTWAIPGNTGFNIHPTPQTTSMLFLSKKKFLLKGS